MKYKLADQIIQIESLYPNIHELLKDYRCDGNADFVLISTSEDIEAERSRSIEKSYSDAYLELLAVQRKLSRWLLTKDVLLFHGSALSMDGRGYIFTAPSGTGKSTHARLWRKCFGERVTMVNDDKPFLKIADDGVTVYGSPWSGKHRLDTNTSVPLHAIALIERAKENSIERMSPLDAVPVLLQQAYREEEMEGIFPLVLKLAEMIPVYKLKCNMEPEAARVAYEGMVLNDL